MPSTTSTLNGPVQKTIQAFADQVLVDGKFSPSLVRDALRVTEGVIEREDQYFGHVAVSNSDLGLLSKHPRHFLKEKILGEGEEEEKDYYKMGNMVEAQLLFPTYFDDLFVQEPENMNEASSPNQKEFCQLVIDGDTPEEAFRQSYSTKRKSEEKIKENAKEKYESLKAYIQLQRDVEESGKTPYSADDIMRVNNIVLNARNNEEVARTLRPDDGEVYVQRPLLGVTEVLGQRVLTKGLADVIVEKSDRVVSIDLKTTSKPLSDFPYSYHKYRYYRQQGLYRSLLRQETDKPVESKCVVLRTADPLGSRVYDVPDGLLKVGEREARELMKRLVTHLKSGYDFQSPLEDQFSGPLVMGAKKDMLERHLQQAQLSTNGQS